MMEARLFRFAVVVAICTFIGWVVMAVLNYRQLDEYQSQAKDLRSRAHQVEVICGRADIPKKDQQTMCDYLPTAQAQQLEAESNVSTFQKNYPILAFWALAFPSGVMALFYAARWIMTGRIRPLVPISPSLSAARVAETQLPGLTEKPLG